MFIENNKITIEEIIENNYSKLKSELKLPDKNKTIFIFQYNGMTPFDIILFILKNEKIKYLEINSFMISIKAVKQLQELRFKDYIENIFFRINALILKNGSSVESVFKTENADFINSHMKLFLIQTQNNKYVIQSSGNFTFKHDIEFITIQNNKELFNKLKQNGKEKRTPTNIS